MSSEMKLIMENWRSHTQKQLLNEVALADFKETVSAVIQLKKAIESGEIAADAGGKILASAVNVMTMGLSGAGRNIVDSLFSTRKLGRLAHAAKLPDKDTESNPFLDVFNIEDEYSQLLDDKLENAFLNHLSNQLEAGALDGVDLASWDINQYLEEFLKAKFNQKSVAGAPPTRIDSAKMGAMIKKIKRSGIMKAIKAAADSAIAGD